MGVDARAAVGILGELTRDQRREIRWLKEDSATWHKAMVEMEDELNKALSLLKRLEWEPCGDQCPACEGWRSEGHDADCELAKFLRENQ